MRILCVITSYFPRWGGTENQLRAQVTELVKRGHAVTVVTWQHDASAPRDEYLDGARVVRVPRNQGTVLALLSMGATLMRHARWADAIAAHQLLYPAYLAGWAALLTGRRIVVKAAASVACPGSDIGMLRGRSASTVARRVLALPLLSRATAAAISSEVRRDLLEAGFRHVAPIPNGIESRRAPDMSALRQEVLEMLDLPKSCRLVVSAGRLEWWKGFEVLIESWPDVLRSCPKCSLVIFGSGPEGPALGVRLERMGLSNVVRVAEPTPRVRDFFAATDVVVVPSFADGLSNVLLEGMASGTPVVATAVSGAVDLVSDGDTGYLVPPRDARSLSEAIVRALRGPRDVGARGQSHVLASCSMTRVVEKYERAFASHGQGTDE